MSNTLGRRLLFCGVSISVSYFLVSPTVFAETSDANLIHASSIKSVEKHQIITDVQQLFTRAKTGISDPHPFRDSSPIATLENMSSHSKIPVKTYTTVQLIEKDTFENGDTKAEYAVTSFAVSPNLSETDTKQATDSSEGILATSTLKLDWETFQGVDCVALIGGSGSWTIEDPTLSLQNKTVGYGEAGISPESKPVAGGFVQDRAGPWAAGMSFNNSFSWPHLVPNSQDFFIDCTMDCLVTGHGSSWDFNFAHNFYSN